MQYRILPLGDTAFTLEYPDLSGVTGARHIRKIRDRFQQLVSGENIVGIVDLISASRSLSICFDPDRVSFERLKEVITGIADSPLEHEGDQGNLWVLPACYEGDYAPDLVEVAENAKLSPEEVINIHSREVYNVLMIGFLPGFPFMAELPDILRFPRRTSPRTRVPAGSVAIANNQTAIYPWDSPGGWHLIGRCPIPLFNPNWEQPSLFSPGDQVRFTPVTVEEFDLLEKDILAGKLDPHQLVKRAEA